MNAITPLKSRVAAASARDASEYARAQALHPALAAHPSPAAILAALASGTGLPYAERDALVLALITEHQRTAHPLWQSLLLIAYEPMLCTIARRTLGVSRADARQGALVAFLEALRKVPEDRSPAYLSLHLRQATERGAFGSVTRTQEPDAIPLAEIRKEPNPNGLLETIERDEKLRKITEELLALFGTEEDARLALHILLHARTSRTAVEAHVEASNPALTRAQKAREVTRLERMRACAVVHLRRVFGAELEELEIRVA